MPRKAPATNPRGTLWSKDENRIGLHMMAKMGWKKGQGLGNKEDGMLEPIKTRPKNNYKGVGFKDRDDQWTAHHDAFNALLKHLNGANDDSPAQPNIVSLEEKSKISKSRVHYKKFLHGKDLSRCTEKDFVCILGKTSQKESEEATNQPNIKEYFEKKMAVLSTRRVIDTGLSKKDYQVTENQVPESPGNKHQINKETIRQEIMELKNVDSKIVPKESSHTYHDDGTPVTSDVSLKKKKRKCTDEVNCEMSCFQESSLEDVKISPKKIKISKQAEETAGNKRIKNRNGLEQGATQQRKAKKTKKIEQLVVEDQDEEETVQHSKKSGTKSKKHLSHNKKAENNTTDNENATKQEKKTEDLDGDTKQRKKSRKSKDTKLLEATTEEHGNGGHISDDKHEDKDTGLLKKDYKVTENQIPESPGYKHQINKEKIRQEMMELKNVDSEAALMESSHSYHDDGMPVTSDVSLKKKKKNVKISPKKIKISKQAEETAGNKRIKNRNGLEQGATQQRKAKKTKKIEQLVVEDQDEEETVQHSKKSGAKSKKHLSHDKNAENNTTDNENATNQEKKTEDLDDDTKQRKKSKKSKKNKSLEATTEEHGDGGTISDDKHEDKGQVSEFRAQLKKMEQLLNNKSDQISDKTGTVGHQTTPQPEEAIPPVYWKKIERLMYQKYKTVELAKEIVELLEKAEPFKGSNLFNVNGYGSPEVEYRPPMNAFTRRAPQYLNTPKRHTPRPSNVHEKQHNKTSAQSHRMPPSIPCYHPNRTERMVQRSGHRGVSTAKNMVQPTTRSTVCRPATSSSRFCARRILRTAIGTSLRTSARQGIHCGKVRHLPFSISTKGQAPTRTYLSVSRPRNTSQTNSQRANMSNRPAFQARSTHQAHTPKSFKLALSFPSSSGPRLQNTHLSVSRPRNTSQTNSQHANMSNRPAFQARRTHQAHTPKSFKLAPSFPSSSGLRLQNTHLSVSRPRNTSQTNSQRANMSNRPAFQARSTHQAHTPKSFKLAPSFPSSSGPRLQNTHLSVSRPRNTSQTNSQHANMSNRPAFQARRTQQAHTPKSFKLAPSFPSSSGPRLQNNFQANNPGRRSLPVSLSMRKWQIHGQCNLHSHRQVPRQPSLRGTYQHGRVSIPRFHAI